MPAIFSPPLTPTTPSPIQDDSVPLSDLISAGEQSRLRRRGALHHPNDRIPARHQSVGVSGHALNVGGSSEMMTYIVFCGGHAQPSSFDEPSSSSTVSWKPTPLPWQDSSNIISPSPPMRRTSNGCGALLRMHAIPSSCLPTLETSSRVDDNEAVLLPIDQTYVDNSGIQFPKNLGSSPCCPCERIAVACSVCGNIVGMRYRPCRQACPSIDAHHHASPPILNQPSYYHVSNVSHSTSSHAQDLEEHNSTASYSSASSTPTIRPTTPQPMNYIYYFLPSQTTSRPPYDPSTYRFHNVVDRDRELVERARSINLGRTFFQRGSSSDLLALRYPPLDPSSSSAEDHIGVNDSGPLPQSIYRSIPEQDSQLAANQTQMTENSTSSPAPISPQPRFRSRQMRNTHPHPETSRLYPRRIVDIAGISTPDFSNQDTSDNAVPVAQSRESEARNPAWSSNAVYGTSIYPPATSSQPSEAATFSSSQVYGRELYPPRRTLGLPESPLATGGPAQGTISPTPQFTAQPDLVLFPSTPRSMTPPPAPRIPYANTLELTEISSRPIRFWERATDHDVEEDEEEDTASLPDLIAPSRDDNTALPSSDVNAAPLAVTTPIRWSRPVPLATTIETISSGPTGVNGARQSLERLHRMFLILREDRVLHRSTPRSEDVATQSQSIVSATQRLRESIREFDAVIEDGLRQVRNSLDGIQSSPPTDGGEQRDELVGIHGRSGAVEGEDDKGWWQGLDLDENGDPRPSSPRNTPPRDLFNR